MVITSGCGSDNLGSIPSSRPNETKLDVNASFFVFKSRIIY